jgi:hypothetical protein
MKLQQLSLFLENRPGQLRAPCQALAEAGVDILTLSLADTAQFGILRIIVPDPARARQVLEQAGMVVNLTEVVPVEVENRPGGLAEVLAHMEQAGLGIEYLYAFALGARPGRAALIFRFEEPDEALRALRARGVRVLEAEELLALKVA